MSMKKDHAFADREVEMDSLDIVPLVASVKLLRGLFREQPVFEAGVDAWGIPNNENPSEDMTVPQAYMTLSAYATIVRELYSQGYRIVKGAEHKPYFTPL